MKKNLCQEQKYSTKNNKWLAQSPFNVPRVMKVKFPQHVMVFGIVSSEGDIMPPHFFDVGLRVDSDVYIDVMKKVALPWIRRVANGRPWVWQQDGARCHTSKKSMAFLREECYDLVPPEMWPPNSPDLNPMDYFVWGVVESRSNSKPHPTKTSLVAAKKEPFQHLPREMVRRACDRFRGRVEAVIREGGGFIE